MSEQQDLSLRFAENMVKLGKSRLAPADLEQVRRLLLDLLGVSLCGSQLPWTLALRDWATPFRGSGVAPVVGAGFTVAPSVAALVNSTAAHGYELDDTHDASMSHPGAVVIPTALAVAAGTHVDEIAVCAAIAAGYETMARVGMAANASRVVAAGFHPTSLFGSFGAATAAALLQSLDAPALARAWGHALSLTGGSMQFSDEPAGTMVKRLHAGYAAQNGILAAGMAKRGVSAPSRALDGKYGLLALYAREPRPQLFDVDPRAPLQIHQISMKPYSCCRLFHSLIDALDEATEGFREPAAGIRHILVRGPGVIFDQHMLRRPTSVMAAQYSLPYVVGATLAVGPHRFDAYRDEHLGNEEILALADKVEGQQDLEIEAEYPEHMGAAVELTMADGSVRSAKVMDSRGTSAHPLTTDAIRAKATNLARDAAPQFDMTAACRTIWQAPAADCQALVQLFAG